MKRHLLVMIMLVSAMGAAFILPKPRYESLDVLSWVQIPTRFPGWQSVDVSKELNLKDDRYNFIENAFARVYRNGYGEELLLMVLDAGNFHNPKVCYTSSGFSIKELEDARLLMDKPAFQAKSLDMRRGNQGTFMFYWLCIDNKIQDWTGQKITEFLATLLNRKKAGLMVRIEIPVVGRNADQARSLAREFVRSLRNAINDDQRQYFFGR